MELPKPSWYGDAVGNDMASSNNNMNNNECQSYMDETLHLSESSMNTIYLKDEDEVEMQFDSVTYLNTDHDVFDCYREEINQISNGNCFDEMYHTHEQQQATLKVLLPQICYETSTDKTDHENSILVEKDGKDQNFVDASFRIDDEKSPSSKTIQYSEVFNSEPSIFREYLKPINNLIVSGKHISNQKLSKNVEKKQTEKISKKKLKGQDQTQAQTQTNMKRKTQQVKVKRLVIESSDNQATSSFSHLVLPLHQIKRK